MQERRPRGRIRLVSRVLLIRCVELLRRIHEYGRRIAQPKRGAPVLNVALQARDLFTLVAAVRIARQQQRLIELGADRVERAARELRRRRGDLFASA